MEFIVISIKRIKDLPKPVIEEEPEVKEEKTSQHELVHQLVENMMDAADIDFSLRQEKLDFNLLVNSTFGFKMSSKDMEEGLRRSDDLA